jgi:hypothetical protein
MLLDLVQRLVGADLASEEARFADLDRAGEDTPGEASERTTEPGKTAVQFAVPRRRSTVETAGGARVPGRRLRVSPRLGAGPHLVPGSIWSRHPDRADGGRSRRG